DPDEARARLEVFDDLPLDVDRLVGRRQDFDCKVRSSAEELRHLSFREPCSGDERNVRTAYPLRVVGKRQYESRSAHDAPASLLAKLPTELGRDVRRHDPVQWPRQVQHDDLAEYELSRRVVVET